MRATDAFALEALLIQALTVSDELEYEQVGAHLATALDALHRAAVPRQPMHGQLMMLHAIEQ